MIQDKQKMKPFWVSRRYHNFAESQTERDHSAAHYESAFNEEKRNVLDGMFRFLSPLMREQVRKKANHKVIQALAAHQQGKYVQNPGFK